MKLLWALPLAGVLLLAAGCHKNPAPDTILPQVHFVYPARGDTFDPGVYTTKAVATDNDSVTSVVFFAYTEMLGVIQRRKGDTFSVAVDCRDDTLATYYLRAFAMDEANNVGYDSVTVYVRR